MPTINCEWDNVGAEELRHEATIEGIVRTDPFNIVARLAAGERLCDIECDLDARDNQHARKKP